ncbi:CocE/NonD family hydrolase [Mucilaginibacter gynuensis]|uniref:CocE/NonD family hydrolase n=1 Tax=Mucilaginibacter gynuensis TaxID=1302236 RepID=A0ABP8FS40_9SPHI
MNTSSKKRKWVLLILLAVAGVSSSLAQVRSVNKEDSLYIHEHYLKVEKLIPMRDGVKLFTSIYIPKDNAHKYPFILNRTPYSVAPYGATEYRTSLGPSSAFIRDGYIFVYQDVRGKWNSEGQFVDTRPFNPSKKGKLEIDESSDTYDTIEWLLRNIPNNNGRVGAWGISYPGFYATATILSGHPALKAVSPQAPVTDWFVGDDITHNGAFFLGNFLFFSSFGQVRPVPTTKGPKRLDIGTQDGYQFFLRNGTFKDLNDKYYKDSIPVWKDFMAHGTYDSFWQSRTPLPHLKNVKPAVLTVGGWFDAEDLYGPLKTFKSIDEKNKNPDNHLVMGPWAHGGWARGDGSSLGYVEFGAATSVFYRDSIEFPFFHHQLKEDGKSKLAAATIFETGSNKWKSYAQWPPAGVDYKNLYLSAGNVLTFNGGSGVADIYDEYTSDPKKPVPFTAEIRTSPGREYMIEDQRFAATRQDVLVYHTPVLDSNVTLTGPIIADLFVSSTGTDADFVVKLIDVYPDTLSNNKNTPANIKLSEFQQLVRADVIRAKFRKSLTQPEPLVSGQVTEVKFELQDVSHTFLKGHKIMVQVQSSWFPLVDRNPQQFLDIYHASESDFKKATQRIYLSGSHHSSLIIPVLQK